MNRYYFDIEDGRTSRDEDGTALPDLDGARLAAVELFGTALRERGSAFWDRCELGLIVRDESDLVLMRLTVFGTLSPAIGNAGYEASSAANGR
jgi:hypothetical protein